LPPEKGAKMLAQEILSEAKRESEKILKAAEKEREMILHGAKISSREEKLRIQKNTEARGRELREQVLAEGRMKVRRERLHRREDLIAQVFQEIRRAIKRHVSTKKYESDLVKIVQRACASLDSQEVQVRANRRDLRMLEGKLKIISEKTGKKVVIGKPIVVLGGARVETTDGRVVIDETLDSRLERNKEKLRVEIAKALFQGSK